MKDEVLVIRIDGDLKEQSQKLAEENGYTLSKLVTASLKELVKKGKIPLNLYPHLGPSKSNTKLGIHDIKTAVSDYLSKHYPDTVEKVYLFGSYSRGQQKRSSDIDIRLICNDSFSLFDVGRISADLKETLGKQVDIVTGTKFSPAFLEELERDQICIYERR